MADVRITHSVVPDDGKDNGIFWRDGIRWLREGKRESPIGALAPEREEQFMKHMDSEMGRIGMKQEHAARDASLKPLLSRSESVALEVAGICYRWQMGVDELIDLMGRHIAAKADELLTDERRQSIMFQLRDAADKMSAASVHYYQATEQEKLIT